MADAGDHNSVTGGGLKLKRRRREEEQEVSATDRLLAGLARGLHTRRAYFFQMSCPSCGERQRDPARTRHPRPDAHVVCRDKRSKKDKTEKRAKTVLAELPSEVR